MAVPLPRVVTVARAHELGFTTARMRTELRRERWRRLTPGVLLTRPDEPTRDDWIQVGLALGAGSGVLTGWDAVRLHGVGPRRPPTAVATVLVGARQRNRVVGRVHLRPSARPTTPTRVPWTHPTLAGVRIAGPARAIADTALELDRFEPVRALVTSAIQRGLCDGRQLSDELAAGPQQGSAFLRRALLDVAAGAHSIAEAEAIELLRQAGITGFQANAPILDRDGALLYRVDLLWPRLRAIVEIDSREFHFSEAEWKATMQRHNVLTGLGYAVTHYPPSDIRRRRRAWALEVGRWLDGRARALAV